MNRTQKLIHRYSINDAIEHLKTIRKIKFTPDESVISEINKSTKTLLKQMRISIT
ncbi:MAG: hypothetical protein VB098_04435 [Petrimonas sp.]|nr:hypothetical protein [Petrimonas sp.]MEA5061729.1 hypothetical protein [Petrimonas sp.]